MRGRDQSLRLASSKIPATLEFDRAIAHYDTIIVGGGLAGACAALWLSQDSSVLVLEANEPASGATGAAAGLVSPFKGLRATPMWRHEEALQALHETLQEAEATDLFHATGVFRPALDAKQVGMFEKAASKFSDQIEWLTANATNDRYPDVNAALGGLWIPAAGTVDLPAFARALLAKATRNGADVRSGVRVLGWTEAPDGCAVETKAGSFESRTVILCLGDGFSAFRELRSLPLHKVKGQTVRLEKPAALSTSLPAVSAGIYVVPEGDEFVVGATFEHEFKHLGADPAVGIELRKQAADLIPLLADTEIVGASAGVRVTVPRVRLPLLGPLLGSRRTWIFTALGAKGLMTAPLLARDLRSFFTDPEALPLEVRPPS